MTTGYFAKSISDQTWILYNFIGRYLSGLQNVHIYWKYKVMREKKWPDQKSTTTNLKAACSMGISHILQGTLNLTFGVKISKIAHLFYIF